MLTLLKRRVDLAGPESDDVLTLSCRPHWGKEEVQFIKSQVPIHLMAFGLYEDFSTSYSIFKLQILYCIGTDIKLINKYKMFSKVPHI